MRPTFLALLPIASASLLLTMAGAAGQVRISEEKLLAAWQDTIFVTTRPATWAARRRAFLEHTSHSSAENVQSDTLDQFDALNTERRYAEAMPRRISKIDGNCVGRALQNCRVLASGRLSVPGGNGILWQTQRGFTPVDGTRGGIVLLQLGAHGIDVIGWSFEGYDWHPPRIIVRADEMLLTAPGRVAGTGKSNADLLYRKAGSAWNEIEIESWKDDMRKRLPAGLGVWKGVNYDFQRMTAVTSVWNSSDGNCCPTAGTATAFLQIDKYRLILTQFKFMPRARGR